MKVPTYIIISQEQHAKDKETVEYVESIACELLFAANNNLRNYDHKFTKNEDDFFTEKVVKLLRRCFPDTTVMKYTMRSLNEKVLVSGLLIDW